MTKRHKTHGFKTAEICALSVLEAGGLKWRCWQGQAVCEAPGGGVSLSASFNFWWPQAFLWAHKSILCLLVAWHALLVFLLLTRTPVLLD